MIGGGPNNSGAERHRILRELRQQLEKHPAVEAAWGHPEGQYTEVSSKVDPTYFGRDAESATIRMTWHPIPPGETKRIRPENPRTDIEAMFTFHYSETSGYDCGFHNEPNPHVDGWLHFQKRHEPSEEYEYTSATLDATSPISALWELLDKLESELRG